MTRANNKQIDGTHYQNDQGIQHWDYAAHHNMGYLEGCATKYICRIYLKGQPLEDLEKSIHYVEKMIDQESKSRCDRVNIEELGALKKGYNLNMRQIWCIYYLTKWDDVDTLRQVVKMLEPIRDDPKLRKGAKC